MQKKPIIIISVLCVISLVLGYLSGLKENERLSNGDAETDSKKEPEFLKEGLVAYYPFNGNAKDESGNGHDGEVLGAVLTFDRNGKAASAYGFNGEASIVIADDEKLRNPHLTISVWIKSLELKYINPHLNKKTATILSKIDAVKPEDLDKSNVPFAQQYRLRLTSYKPSFEISLESIPRNFKVATATEMINQNNWDLVVGTWDGMVQNIFLNGVLVGSNANAPDGNIRNIIGGDLLLGRGWHPTNDHHFNGELDDLRIYNRALSADEVKALYEFEKAE